MLCIVIPDQNKTTPKPANMAIFTTLKKLACKLPKWWCLSLLVWTLLSAHHENAIPLALKGQHIQLLIAHPDDEVMFFAPALIELAKEEHGNVISVTCFSTGNAEGLGEVRARELRRSLEILGVSNVVVVLDDESKFKDGMDIEWASNDIVELVEESTSVVLTFDSGGVSQHPNHRSLYHAAMATGKKVACLHTYPLWAKYSATFVSNWQLVAGDEPPLVTIHSNWANYVLALAAMVSGHRSQMEWFRYGWLLCSSYLYTNRLVLH